jgi:hypothetical protein
MVDSELCVIGVWRVENVYNGCMDWVRIGYLGIEEGARCLGRDSAYTSRTCLGAQRNHASASKIPLYLWDNFSGLVYFLFRCISAVLSNRFQGRFHPSAALGQIPKMDREPLLKHRVSRSLR